MKRRVFQGEPTWRVVAARHPPIPLFERVADAGDFDDLVALEAAFSPHYDDTRLLESLPRSQWVHGPGCGYLMAPFAYRAASRFSDGSFGVYYAGLDEVTAITEVAYHRGLFLAATLEPVCLLEEQIIQAAVTGDLVDLNLEASAHPEWYDPFDYTQSQALGRSLRNAGEAGLAFASVRHPGGACIGAFRPTLLGDCHQLRPLRYFWDGKAIAGWC